MTQPTFRILAVILWAMAFGSLARAQAPAAAGTTVKVRVIVSAQGTTETLPSEPGTITVAANPSGKFTVDLKSFEPSYPAECAPSYSRSPQRVGVKLEGTVTPTSDGGFEAHLTISDRAIAGCRVVGDLTIPVFSNLIIAKDAQVGKGETLSFTVRDKSTGQPLQVQLTVAP